MIKALLLFSMFSLAEANAQAAERYQLPDGTILEGVERFNGALPSDALTILGMTLDVNNFADVRNALGTSANITISNDPHDADSVCYLNSVDHREHLIFFAGSPEDPTDKLTSFTLSSNELPHVKGRCAESAKLTKNVGTSNALKLGLSQGEVTSILGSPSKTSPNWIIYAYQKYREYSPSERANKPRAPGGGEYKGEYTYHDLLIHFANGSSDMLSVYVGGETDW